MNKYKKTFKLNQILILVFSGFALALTLSLLSFSNIYIKSKFEEYKREDQIQETEKIVSLVNEEYSKNEGAPDPMFFHMLSMDALNNGLILSISDTNGEIIFSSTQANQYSCDVMYNELQSNLDLVSLDYSEYSEKTYPIESGSITYGNVSVGYYAPYYYQDIDVLFIKSLNTIFIVVGIMALIILIIFGILLAKYITTPLLKFVNHTKSVETGNYSSRLQINSYSTEIIELTNSINSLTLSLNNNDKIKKRMAADYAHEIRTPLAIIQSNLEAMIDGIYEPSIDNLRVCKDEIVRLEKMIGKIDEIVQLETLSKTLILSKFNFKKFIENSVLIFEGDLSEKNITIELELENIEITADKDKIQQVFTNLMSNAIKYSNNGNTILIKLYCNDKIIFEIIDQGIGISSEDLPFIFEYLYRCDTSRAKQTGGEGIGLAVCKAIVLSHNGEITASSKLGVGTSIRVTLPLE